MTTKTLSAKNFFKQLNSETMSLVDDFYHENVLFQDPLTILSGRERLKSYYINMYKNVISISWDFSEEVVSGRTTVLFWKMMLTAKDFNGNKPLDLDGVSIMKVDEKTDKVIYHRDYFDMGAFVYEGIPVLGSVIRFVKQKMKNH